MVIPTLAADDALAECLLSLERQSWRNFQVVVVDNSGHGRVLAGDPVRVLRSPANLGFGASINHAFAQFPAEFLATLNDDAAADTQWLEELVRAADDRPDAGMCASRVLLDGRHLDSAGLLLCGDGVAKQRGHGQPPELFAGPEEILLPSAAAALYRKAMLDETGGFDDHFFLYCEDTDLGLRARWAGWRCLYVPTAVVTHRYSHSAGRASALKAYYVERNRLFVVVKNFPAGMLAATPVFALRRYFWHAFGGGAAQRHRERDGSTASLAVLTARAHWDSLRALPRLWRQRAQIRGSARITPSEFRSLARRYRISPREVAAQ